MQWSRIVDLLEAQVAGVAVKLPLPRPHVSRHVLKAYEDALDAVICAYIGIHILEGRATAFGDEMSSIWVPTSTGCGGIVSDVRDVT